MATIYSITSMKGNKVYIGSTTMTLARRKACHKARNDCKSVLLKEEYGWDNLIFTVLEECPIEQQLERERFHIENTENTVNYLIHGRSIEEKKDNWKKYKSDYNKQNKERDKQSRKEAMMRYYEAHKDEINRKCKERYEANKAKKQSNTL